MRIGPLGLIHDFDADFYIIKEQKTKECQAYKKSQEISENLKAQLKTLPANQITAEFFSFLNPLSLYNFIESLLIDVSVTFHSALKLFSSSFFPNSPTTL